MPFYCALPLWNYVTCCFAPYGATKGKNAVVVALPRMGQQRAKTGLSLPFGQKRNGGLPPSCRCPLGVGSSLRPRSLPPSGGYEPSGQPKRQNHRGTTTISFAVCFVFPLCSLFASLYERSLTTLSYLPLRSKTKGKLLPSVAPSCPMGKVSFTPSGSLCRTPSGG